MTHTSLFNLTGKTALVTGASRGIGRAIALGLAEAGADVAVLARSTKDLTALAEEISTTTGQDSLVLTCDVSDEDQVNQAVAATIAHFGHLDICVNNAGGTNVFSPFLDMETQDWHEIIDLNLKSTVYFCRAVGREMVQRRAGSIINVTSVTGQAGFPMISHYSASKAAAINLTQSLGAEWASAGVRVNTLMPGWVQTQLTEVVTSSADIGNRLRHAVPARRWGQPEDLIGPTVFLASDASRFITGARLVADGGLTAYNGGPATIDLMELGRVPAYTP